ncbi:MAG: NTP transferase domain-containing protein, partial [Burkholderiales bacterium]|nr:NTP transferase domain-containing protein [Opitutaceae bacterium]
MHAAAIILAAGAGSRWQGAAPKPLTRLGGETFVDRAARAAIEAGCTP